MFAKVGIIQQSAKHNLKKNFEARQYRLEIHVGIGISATKRKNEGVSLALRKQDSNPKNIYPLRTKRTAFYAKFQTLIDI